MGTMILPRLREYLFPSGCGGCGEVPQSREDAYYGLCGECRRFFVSAFEGEKRCGICGKFLVSERDTCLSCREREKAGADAGGAPLIKPRALFPYTGKFHTILGAYKFERSRAIANFFVPYLTSSLRDFDFGAWSGAAWVPVPPRPGKIKTRGWDQIEYLAKLLKREYRRGIAEKTRPRSLPQPLPVLRCLKRLPSLSQKELNREERLSNLKGRILCTAKPPETAVLFDDVITTGATLSACADALLKSGARRVYGVCLFYD